MTPFADIENGIDAAERTSDAPAAAARLLTLGEAVLENWIEAKDQAPTDEKVEGFRLLALHRQGAKGDPSFNACRETCRELVYHYNLIQTHPKQPGTPQHVKLMAAVARHMLLFVSGKMENAKLGEFCCSARPLRAESA